jgi:nicotinamidase-related amidase
VKTRRTMNVVAGSLVALAAVAAIVMTLVDRATAQAQAQAQAQGQGERAGAAIPGITRQPSPAAREVLLDPNDTVVLLLDHQTGLFQTVKDVRLRDLRANTVVLAKIAEQAKVPIIYTASVPEGTNGPIMDELAAAMPNAKYIARQGEVSAWDNADFVQAVESTGRKTLVMAGVWTSVCVAFPALQAKADGYKVYAVMDASGDMSEMASDVALARMTHAGVVPVTTNVVLCEMQRTWNRPDASQWGELYAELVPNYRAVGESYRGAQQAAQAQGNRPQAQGERQDQGQRQGQGQGVAR